MCGIVGLFSHEPVNQRLYDSLLLLQHRGQDAAGIATLDGLTFHIHKAMGLVRDVFRTRNMRDLLGNSGLGQVRYPTQGNADSNEESQPFYVNAPYGIMFVHNGNLTNAEALKQELYDSDRRHINTTSDSEVLLNVLADELSRLTLNSKISPEIVFEAVKGVHKRVKGSYACIALIAGKGMLAFRDPFGIRPLCYGTKETSTGRDVIFASESDVLKAQEYETLQNVAPGEAIWVDMKGDIHQAQCAEHAQLVPCAFEYVYLARPDSVIDGISVYGARLRLGEYLAHEVARRIPVDEIDVVMPIPDSSRPAAQQLAQRLRLPYREGFIKNRYVGRTFIMPGQAIRKKTVRQKLNAMAVEFKDKNVLLVDDSIVRGTTMVQLVKMLRNAGAKEIHIRINSPEVIWPCFYGIDTDVQSQLISANKTVDEICEYIGADSLAFLSVEGLLKVMPKGGYCDACFTGRYPVAIPESFGRDKFMEGFKPRNLDKPLHFDDDAVVEKYDDRSWEEKHGEA